MRETISNIVKVSFSPQDYVLLTVHGEPRLSPLGASVSYAPMLLPRDAPFPHYYVNFPSVHEYYPVQWFFVLRYIKMGREYTAVFPWPPFSWDCGRFFLQVVEDTLMYSTPPPGTNLTFVSSALDRMRILGDVDESMQTRILNLCWSLVYAFCTARTHSGTCVEWLRLIHAEATSLRIV